MTLNSTFTELRMRFTRLQNDMQSVTATQTQALKDGEVLADDGHSYSTIQEAQDAASSWIKIPPGTFNESVTIDTPGLTVQGSGYESYIYPESGEAINAASDVLVDNVRMKSADDSAIYGSDNVVVTNSHASTTTNGVHAIDLSSQNTKAISCVAEYAQNQGIHTGTSSIVVGCRVIETGQYNGIRTTGDDAIIANNIINNNINRYGIYVTYTNDCIVYSNRVFNTGNNPIRILGTDNIVVNNRTSGSIQDDGTSNLVQDNLTTSSN